MSSGCKFILQVVGITAGRIINHPSRFFPSDLISDVFLIKDGRPALVYTPSLECTGLVASGIDVLVAYCQDDYEMPYGDKCTYTIFLSIFKENEENEQVIGINPKIAMELMESVIEKDLISVLPHVRYCKRNVAMKMEGKIDSCFSFAGMCEDNIPFIMEVSNVPFAEYNHGGDSAPSAPVGGSTPSAPVSGKADASSINELLVTASPETGVEGGIPPTGVEGAEPPDEEMSPYDLKTAYFPEKGKKATPEMLKKIRELTLIKKESVTRCILGFIIERTDIHRFEISLYDDEYRMAVKKAIETGVDIVPVVVSWTKEGVAFFVTDELPVVFPH